MTLIVFFFLVLSLGLGTFFLIRCYDPLEGEGYLRTSCTEGSLGANCYIFCVVGIVGLVVSMVSTDFVARRSIGLFLITTYVLGFITLCLSEGGVVHPFGTDHSQDRN